MSERLLINCVTGEAVVKEHSAAERARLDAQRLVDIEKEPYREAMEVLRSWDAKGYTRAWETSVAPLVAAETLPEYDATVLAEKKAARAVVEG
jgi:hypothetical protein